MNQTAQFHRRSKQLNIRLAPIGGIRQFVGIVENTLQPTKTGILAQHRNLLGSLRPAPLDTEAKRHPYSLDVVAHYLKTIITHSRQVFRRLYQAIQSA